MAHEVETMMYVGEVPWHKLGKAIPEGKTLNIQEAITAAGLDWEVGMKQLFAAHEGEEHRLVQDHMATYRIKDRGDK